MMMIMRTMAVCAALGDARRPLLSENYQNLVLAQRGSETSSALDEIYIGIREASTWDETELSLTHGQS